MPEPLAPLPDFKEKIAELEAQLSRGPGNGTSSPGARADEEAKADQDFLEAIRKAEEEEEQAVAPAAKLRRLEPPAVAAPRATPPVSDRVCTDCSSTSTEGALDDGNGCWYCKRCWEKVLGTTSASSPASDTQATPSMSKAAGAGPSVPSLVEAPAATASTKAAAPPLPGKTAAIVPKAGATALAPLTFNLPPNGGPASLLGATASASGPTAVAVAAAAGTNSGPASALSLLGGVAAGGGATSLPALSGDLAGLLVGGGAAGLLGGLSPDNGAASSGANVNGASSRGPLAHHQAESEQRTAQWAQVFSAMLQAGIEERASEYAQYLGKLQEVTKECLKRYHEAVAMEEQLLTTASHEAAQAHLMAQVQKQAQVEMASQGAQVKAEVQAAHQSAAMAVAEQESKITKTPVRRYPKRPGMPPCQFYQRTGDCHYGITCKWDHPDRPGSNVPLNSKGYPLRPGETPCAFYMRTGECKFAATCKWDHPESPAAAAMNANAKLVEAALAGARANEAAMTAATAAGAL